MRNFLKYDDTQVLKYDSILLAVIYTVGHIFIAMTCNRIITGASLNMAAADAFVEPIVNGFWFYLLFVVFNKYKMRSKAYSGKSSKSPAPGAYQSSKLAPVNNKKNID